MAIPSSGTTKQQHYQPAALPSSGTTNQRHYQAAARPSTLLEMTALAAKHKTEEQY